MFRGEVGDKLSLISIIQKDVGWALFKALVKLNIILANFKLYLRRQDKKGDYALITRPKIHVAGGVQALQTRLSSRGEGTR